MIFTTRSAAGVYGHVLCLPCHSPAISSGHQMASAGVEKSLMVANGSPMHLKLLVANCNDSRCALLDG